MTDRYREKPLKRVALPENAPSVCKQCRAPFVAASWPRSKWTLSGWSPWCPKCNAKHAPHREQRARPGPKPKKRGVASGGWTNLPC